MKMTFRWYGSQIDPIPLKYVKQIPGMSGLMGLLDKPAGVVWEEDEIKALVDEVHACGLELEVIESVNVHEDIKMGLPTRDEYIANYITTIRNLAKYGVKVIVYNFMPVFDWLRTDLAREIPEDGSNSLYFNEVDLGEMGPMEIVRRTAEDSKGFTLPGWEPERLALLETTLKQYEGITHDMLRENYKYFLERVCPV
ncbi:MAG: mannonate dehydratase, partial [Clostridia bacterium]|nr:mannonate dehydratase [Clostridia bacterium]